VLLALMALALLPIALYLNLGPYQEYQKARERLGDKQQEVALVQKENANLRAEMDRLQKDTYLEALARKELAYARPGEEVFIVKGLPEATEAAAQEQAKAPPEPGPLERLVEAVRQAF
jgi:cell division protein FtsB